MSIYVILIKREQSGVIPILQMCLQRHREVTCPRSHGGTARKAHALKSIHDAVFSSQFKGRDIEKCKRGARIA